MADDDTVEEDQEPKRGGKLKLILMIVLGVLLIAGLSIGATWFLLKDKLAPNDPEVGENGEPVEEVMQEAIYYPLDPAFVINYSTAGKSRFLQIELSLLYRDPAVTDLLTLHEPLIRNNLLAIFSTQNVVDLGSVQGKEQLVNTLTSEVNALLVDEMESTGIETVLYRSFIMQ